MRWSASRPSSATSSGTRMREYAVKVGNSIFGTGSGSGSPYFRSPAEAQKEIRDMEDADRTYDIPSSPKRTIVYREVGKWQKWDNSNKSNGSRH